MVFAAEELERPIIQHAAEIAGLIHDVLRVVVEGVPHERFARQLGLIVITQRHVRSPDVYLADRARGAWFSIGADHQTARSGHRLADRNELAIEVVAEVRDADNNGHYLCAYVVLHQGEETDSLKDHLSLHLPAPAVPSFYVTLEALPLTLNGKVDRRALPAPERVRSNRSAFVAPRTATEEEVARVWSELLGLARVGIHDNFFDLGGHSLLATQLMSRLREAFDVSISLGVLFDDPSVEGLAAAITSSRAEQASADDLTQLLAELEHLSDEEARVLTGG